MASFPASTVTLTNEATNISREVVTNDVGQYNFPGGAARHLHAEDAAHGLQDATRAKGLIVGTQQFITLDVTLEVGAIEEIDHRHRAVAADRHVERVDRRRARSAGARVAAGARAATRS